MADAPGSAFVFPMSYAQRRLWFLYNFAPDSPLYNIPAPFRFRMPLNVDAFRRAVNEIVRRHESLRTTFRVIDAEPMQVIAETAEVKVEVVDLRQLPRDEREPEAQRLAAIDAQQPFDLENGPLFRASILQLGAGDYVLLLTMHHIVSDGWSMRVFFRELGALYSAYSSGRPTPLPDLKIQYADYAHWQQQLLQGPLFEEHLAYWRTHLAAMPERTPLPLDRPRTSVQLHQGGVFNFTIGRPLLESVVSLGKHASATTFMVLLAAFKALLARYTGDTDIVVGTPIANRTRADVESLIGLFVNTLVLRTRLTGDATFDELLARVREVTLDAYSHQDVPFERLVEELQPARNLGHNPLFQVMFVMQSSESAAKPGDVDVAAPEPAPIEAPTGTAKFDLTLSVAESAAGAYASIEYASSLFDEATMRQFADHYLALLEAAVADPSSRVTELDLGRGIGHIQAPAPVASPPSDPRTVEDVIRESAARSPHETALVVGDERLTFDELEGRSRAMAAWLLASGANCGDRIALLLPHSADLVAAEIAIARIGAAFVPLEPETPAAYNLVILANAGADWVVTTRALPTHVAGEVPVLLLDDFDGSRPIEPAVLESDPAAAACVLYRGGCRNPDASGVIVANGLLATPYAGAGWSLVATDRIAHITSLLGNGVFRLFGALEVGALQVCIPPSPAMPPRQLANLLRREKITVLHAPAAIVERLATEFPNSLESVRFVLTSDTPHALRQLANLIGPGVRDKVLAVFESAETGGISLTQPLSAITDGAGMALIGAAAEGAYVQVLDPAGNETPEGILGEVCIGGVRVADGHTAPISARANHSADTPVWINGSGAPRRVRTGEMVRRLADGGLERWGRCDGRALRGRVWVDPYVAEQVLCEHRPVAVAAVVARVEDDRVDAFVEVDGEHRGVTAADLTAFLAERLPPGLLPDTMTLLDELPRAAGLIDRAALARYHVEAERRRDASLAEYIAPRNDTEQRLAAIWARALELEQIGVHEDFFAFGGHSLLATRVVAEIHEEFGVALSLTDFFESPNVERVALLLAEPAASEPGAAAPPVIRQRSGKSVEVDVSSLSEAELDAMLNDLAAGKEVLR